jgi:hypothetical protein
MFRRMLVLRRIAARDIPAKKAHPQMNPRIAHLDAFLASLRVRLHLMNLIEMSTFARHKILLFFDLALVGADDSGRIPARQGAPAAALVVHQPRTPNETTTAVSHYFFATISTDVRVSALHPHRAFQPAEARPLLR